MITNKQWKEYKKKNNVPDGLCPKVSLGKVLDTYDKGRKTEADFKKLEDAVKTYRAAAKRAGHTKADTYLEMHLNSEIAARDEEAANRPKAKPVLSPQAAKHFRRLVDTLVKHHANLAAIAKAIKDKPEKLEQLSKPLQGELEKLFRFCRDEGGDTVDIALAYGFRLRNVSSMDPDDLVSALTDCNKMIKGTAKELGKRL